MGRLITAMMDYYNTLLIGIIEFCLKNMFTDVNDGMKYVVVFAGKGPGVMLPEAFEMIKKLSDNVMLPLSCIIISFILTYELISMVIDKNNMHEVDSALLARYLFKAAASVFRILNMYAVQTVKFPSHAASWYISKRKEQKEDLWNSVLSEAKKCTEPLLICGDLQEDTQSGMHIKQLMEMGFKEKNGGFFPTVKNDIFETTPNIDHFLYNPAAWESFYPISFEYDGTRANYTYMYNHFVRDTFGKRVIGEIKYSDVVFFYQHLLNERGLQINTLDTVHTILHPVFQMAVRDNIIRGNPTDGVMKQIKKTPGKNKGVRHALTEAQQKAFVKYIETNPEFYHWMPFMKFLLGTGCRIGEAIGIRWEDVDFEKRTISINHSLVYYSREYKEHSVCSFGVSLPKTEAGIRVIPMMDSVKDALQMELEDQKEYGFNETVIDGMSGFVFMNRFGNVHNPQAVNRALRRITDSYNSEEEVNAAKAHREPLLLPHFSCHHLRHTFCSRLCENETNLKVIQTIMGHAGIETTMDIYAEVNGPKLSETMKSLEDKLGIF